MKAFHCQQYTNLCFRNITQRIFWDLRFIVKLCTANLSSQRHLHDKSLKLSKTFFDVMTHFSPPEKNVIIYYKSSFSVVFFPALPGGRENETEWEIINCCSQRLRSIISDTTQNFIIYSVTFYKGHVQTPKKLPYSPLASIIATIHDQ